jgi:hypothetical protein
MVLCLPYIQYFTFHPTPKARNYKGDK